MSTGHLLVGLFRRTAALQASILTTLILTACQTAPVDQLSAQPQHGSAANADELLPVDCLLPGQVRKLGSQLTYLSPRRPIKTTALDCEIRGGEYVAFDRADYRTALNVWLEQAKAGDPQAQTYVGEIFEKGLGLTPDYGAAREWYLKAAEQGYSRAQINMGYLYEKGLGVEQDVVTALNWYRRASGLQDDEIEYASTLEVQATALAEERTQPLRDEIERRKQEADALRAQLRTTSEELESRKRSLSDAEIRLAELNARLSELEYVPAGEVEVGEIEVVTRDWSRDVEIQELRKQIALERATVEQQQEEIASITAQMSQQNQILNSELLAARRVEQELQQQAAASQQDAQAAQRQLEQATSQLAQQSRETEALRAQLSDSQQQLAEAQSQMAALEAELSQERSNAEQLSAAASAESDAQVRALEQQIAQREKALAEQSAQVAALQRQTERYRADLAALEAPAQAALLAGPSIEILDPPVALTRDSIPSVTLRSPAKTRDIIGKVIAPAGLLSLTVNDRTLTPDEGGVFRASVPVRETDTPVNVAAVDKQGQRASVDFMLIPKLRLAATTESLREDETAPTAALKAIQFGDYHALIIGNNDYADLPNLDTAVNDAKFADELLRSKYGFKTTLLLNADRYTILSALNQLRETLTADDNLLVYYAGHGELDRVNLQGYWLPVDAEPNSTANWISNIAITELLNAMSAKHVLVIADSCYSGAMTRASIARLQSGMSDDVRYKWMTVMAKTRSRTVLTSGGEQPVLDAGGGEHSVFAKAFFDVLQNNDQVLEGYSIYRAIADRVQQIAARFRIEQEPQYTPIRHAGHEAGEFLFVPLNLRS